MKCQILFSGKIRKILSSAELAKRVVKVKVTPFLCMRQIHVTLEMGHPEFSLAAVYNLYSVHLSQYFGLLLCLCIFFLTKKTININFGGNKFTWSAQ